MSERNHISPLKYGGKPNNQVYIKNISDASSLSFSFLRDVYVSRKPRSPWKGRGKTEKPTCPKCGKDIRRSYELKECSTSKRAYGWHCRECKHQEWD